MRTLQKNQRLLSMIQFENLSQLRLAYLSTNSRNFSNYHRAIHDHVV